MKVVVRKAPDLSGFIVKGSSPTSQVFRRRTGYVRKFKRNYTFHTSIDASDATIFRSKAAATKAIAAIKKQSEDSPTLVIIPAKVALKVSYRARVKESMIEIRATPQQAEVSSLRTPSEALADLIETHTRDAKRHQALAKQCHKQSKQAAAVAREFERDAARSNRMAKKFLKVLAEFKDREGA